MNPVTLLLVTVLAEVVFKPGTTPLPQPAVPKGARVNEQEFQHARSFDPGPPGWKVLKLDAAALAGSSGISDYRIIDQNGYQIPYLLQTVEERVTVALPALMKINREKRESRRGKTSWSTYEIELPFRSMPPFSLKLTSVDTVFERRIQVFVPQENSHRDGPFTDQNSRVLFDATYSHRDPSTPPSPFAIQLPRLQTPFLFLEIDEGDNQPLRFRRPDIELQGYELLFFNESEQPLKLLYGNVHIGPPRYDLALLGTSALTTAVRIDLPAPEPEAAPKRPFWKSESALWIVLSAAVAILLALIVRMLRAGVDPKTDPPAKDPRV